MTAAAEVLARYELVKAALADLADPDLEATPARRWKLEVRRHLLRCLKGDMWTHYQLVADAERPLPPMTEERDHLREAEVRLGEELAAAGPDERPEVEDALAALRSGWRGRQFNSPRPLERLAAALPRGTTLEGCQPLAALSRKIRRQEERLAARVAKVPELPEEVEAGVS